MTKPLDPRDIHQQFKIVGNTYFSAKSVARDGIPPDFLSTKYWLLRKRRPKRFKLAEALGLDTALRARLPDVNSKSSEAVKVGMWYCPFMFIKDGTLVYQVENSMYYEMTLEQRWELIFERENDHINNNAVIISASVETEVVLVAGREAAWDEKNVVDKVIWFKCIEKIGDEVSVGLSIAIVERMKWEEERAGWVGVEERQVRVNKVEEFGGGAEGWRKFGCYVLVERFALRRMDGSLVMTYDFKHTHQLKCIWE